MGRGHVQDKPCQTKAMGWNVSPVEPLALDKIAPRLPATPSSRFRRPQRRGGMLSPFGLSPVPTTAWGLAEAGELGDTTEQSRCD